MIRKPLLVVAAVLALSGPAGASVILTLPIPPQSDYEAVDTAARVVLARSVVLGGGEVDLKIQEVLKGQAGETLRVRGHERDQWCVMSQDGCYQTGSLYLLFLDESDEPVPQDAVTGNVEVVEPDGDWVRTARLFAGISALDDAEKEREALQQLRKAAAEDAKGDGKCRYPAGLVRRIDRHFALPSPKKPFSELKDLYYAAEMDFERLEVLWAMFGGQHPETPSFFRGMLFAGEPDRLLVPAMALFREHPEQLPLAADLGRLYLAASPGERKALLELILMQTEAKDDSLLWSLLPGSNQPEFNILAGAVLGRKNPAPRLERLALPGRVRTRLLFYRMTGMPALPAIVWLRLNALLEAGVQNPQASAEELAAAFEASADRQERHRIVKDLVLRAEPADLPAAWRLLGQAEGEDADLLLAWFAGSLPDFPVRASLYRSARTDEERNRALWVAATTYAFRFMTLGGLTDDKSRTLERLVRAFVTCPNEDAQALILGRITDLADTADSMPALLETLRAATPRHADALLSWFARHPNPEALPYLRRLAGPLPEEDFAARDLAAAGDPEVVERAVRVLSRPGRENNPWALDTLARSPLPAAAEALRRHSERP